MIPGKITNATRILGKPKDWDVALLGPCSALEIQDIEHEGKNVMYSAWFPNEEELSTLLTGAPVVLGIVGMQHPVVSIQVGAVSEEASKDVPDIFETRD